MTATLGARTVTIGQRQETHVTSNPRLPPTAEQAIRTLRVVVAGMAAAVAGVAAVMVALDRPPVMPAHVMLIVLLALAASAVPAYVFVRRALIAQAAAKRRAAARGRGPESAVGGDPLDEFAGVYLHVTLIGAALVEGVGVFGAIAYLVTGSWSALAAVGFALAGLAAQYPTRDKLQSLAQRVVQQSAG